MPFLLRTDTESDSNLERPDGVFETPAKPNTSTKTQGGQYA